tara:strand:+ start:154 stop:615 length:462 start_codon:yes stop_codon:yes gene_type:complete
MNLYIEGYRTQNKKLVEDITSAAYYFVYELVGGRFARNITVDIKLTKDLKQKTGAYGFCQIMDDVDKPREFELEIDASTKHDVSQILTWIAHECVHLKQFVLGELYDYEDNTVQWKTKRYKLHMDYDDMPWEREAYRLETKLYEKWEEQNGTE